jgi:flagellar M-ring protein FliF
MASSPRVVIKPAFTRRPEFPAHRLNAAGSFFRAAMADGREIIANLARSGRMRVAGALAVTALVGGGLGVIMMRGDEAGSALLYSGLDLGEATEIAGRLDQANIRYDLRADGSAIFVDRAAVLDARMMLAEEGLPTRGSVGYEIFDQTDALGATTFVQNINRVRALEGELARSISSFEMVQAARVHLVLPERRLFERQGDQPSASVVVQVRGDGLSAGQVRAVRNLVAGAVPGLAVDRVTVLDDKGRLLAAGAESAESGFGGVSADERKAALEERYRQTVLQLVESVTGPGAARVQVAAEVDFNRVTSSAETFDPESRVVRSSTTIEDTSSETETPPAGETTVANNVPTGAGDPAEATPTASASANRTEETVNYEISKSTRTEIVEGGRIERLSVAVLVDDRRVTAEDGSVTFEPRPAEELARIATLVKSAVGFQEPRGDIVEVVNSSFARPDLAFDEGAAPGAFDFDKFDVMRAVEIAALLLTAVMLVLFVLRPLARGLSSKDGGALADLSAPGAEAGAAGDAAARAGLIAKLEQAVAEDGAQPDNLGIDLARISGQVKASSIRKISEVVGAHPDESLTIIRSWLAEDRESRV